MLDPMIFQLWSKLVIQLVVHFQIIRGLYSYILDVWILTIRYHLQMVVSTAEDGPG